MNESRGLILVGVDGTAAGLAATGYAATEAARAGAALHLVHVIDPYVPPIAAWPVGPGRPDSALVRHGREILAEAEESVAGSGAVVSTYLLLGRAATVLVQEAAKARLVVLGDQPRSLLDRIITSSVLAPVAAHAPAPVVGVPAGWQSEETPHEIIVGVQDAATSIALVRRGLQVAAERGARLRVLHSWEAFGAYQDPLTVGSEEHLWAERAERELTAALGAARAEAGPAVAEVEAKVEVVHGQTAYVLREASRSAELLILGRGRSLFGFGHLGGTARAVLRESACPVEIDPPTASVLTGGEEKTGAETADGTAAAASTSASPSAPMSVSAAVGTSR